MASGPDRSTIWISDSGKDKLFAHDLESGERLPDSDLALHPDNDDARGIWSDGSTMWVLDYRDDALFAYDLAGGALLAEYALHDDNDRAPRHLVRRRQRLGLQPRPEAPLRLPPPHARR